MKIANVIDAKAFTVSLPFGFSYAVISALGEVATSGWMNGRLTPYFSVTSAEPDKSLVPADGILDLAFVADAPTGPVLQVVLPITAQALLPVPTWAKGVRIHAEAGAVLAMFGSAEVAQAGRSIALASERSIIHRELAVYDDSIQPTGTIHWKNDGPFGTPNPHLEMKALTHRLVLIVEGPSEDKINQCINQALTTALITALVSAFVTGGLGAIGAAGSSMASALIGCLGEASVRFEDASSWHYWDL